jgi:hypothetical protein
MLLSAIFCLLAVYSGLAQVTDSPTVAAVATPNDTQMPGFFAGWSSWDGVTATAPITPNDPIPSFNSSLCPKATSCPRNTRTLYIIHIADWTRDAVNTGNISVDSSTWFLYRFADNGVVAAFRRIATPGGSFPTLYDYDSAIIISISRLRNAAVGNFDGSQAPTIQYVATPTQNTPQWLTDLEAIGGGLAGPKISASASTNVSGAGGPGPNTRTAVRIQVITVNTKPLKRPFSLALTANASSTLEGTGDCGNVTRHSTCSFSQKITVTARQIIDFGLNIVPYGPIERKYTIAAPDPATLIGTVTVAPTRHNAVYAVADIFPFGFKAADTTHYPYIQTGLPLSGAALRIPYLGMAEHVPGSEKFLAVSVYAGVVFMKQSYPKTFAPGQMTTSTLLAADFHTDHAVKLVWGVEVPLSSFASAINGHKFK